MKDEEIEKAAKEIVRELVRYCDQTPDDVEAALVILRRVVSQARDEALDEVLKGAQAARDGQRYASLGTDPYARGCIDTANAVDRRVRSLKMSG